MSEKISPAAAIYIASGMEATISHVEASVRQASQHAKNEIHGAVSRAYFAQQENDLVQTLAEIKRFRRAVFSKAFPPLPEESSK